MTLDDLRQLFNHGESTWLDWKAQSPPGLASGNRHPDWDKGRAELLKDIVCIANGNDGRDTGYLVYGVKDLGTARQIVGGAVPLDDADIQTWVRAHLDPPVAFVASRHEPQPSLSVLSIEIHRVPQYPHVVKQSLGGIIHTGQVWFRSGTQNAVALRASLEAFFQTPEPIRIERLAGTIMDTLKDHYASLGEELALPRFGDKDEKLAQGYRIAFYPGTRREVWAGQNGRNYDHIVMLKPRQP